MGVRTWKIFQALKTAFKMSTLYMRFDRQLWFKVSNIWSFKQTSMHGWCCFEKKLMLSSRKCRLFARCVTSAPPICLWSLGHDRSHVAWLSVSLSQPLLTASVYLHTLHCKQQLKKQAAILITAYTELILRDDFKAIAALTHTHFICNGHSQ